MDNMKKCLVLKLASSTFTVGALHLTGLVRKSRKANLSVVFLTGLAGIKAYKLARDMVLILSVVQS